MSTFLIVVLMGLLPAAILAVFIRSLLYRTNSIPSGIEWLSEFSIDNYRPMERLLGEADYEFLSRQPGYEPRIARKLRAEHRRIFRIYLRALIGDFNKLMHVAKLVAVLGSEDRPDFTKELFRLRMRFYWSVLVVQFQLALAPLPVGSVDVPKLIGSLAILRDDIQQSALMQRII